MSSPGGAYDDDEDGAAGNAALSGEHCVSDMTTRRRGLAKRVPLVWRLSHGLSHSGTAAASRLQLESHTHITNPSKEAIMCLRVRRLACSTRMV